MHITNISYFMSFFFLSVQLQISEEDHLVRSLATYLFLLHFRFPLIYKWRTTRQYLISLLYIITEKMIEIKLDCQPCWTKQRSDIDYMNNYITIYKKVQCKEVKYSFELCVFLWPHGGHVCVPKQWNGCHVCVPNQSCGSWTLFLCKRFLLFQ